MTEYVRRDYRLQVLREPGRPVARLVGPDGSVLRVELEDALLALAAAGEDANLRKVLVPLYEKFVSATPDPSPSALTRLCVSLADRTWAAIDWEGFAPPHSCVVRVSEVRPRVGQIPFTFPMRILESGGESPKVPQLLEVTFHGTRRDQAVVDAWVPGGALASLPPSLPWPTVDLLHLRDVDFDENGRRALIRWLQPFAERYQTRLVLFDCAPTFLGIAKQVAQTLVDRSGPAVWVVGSTSGQWGSLYDLLIHDRPLDWIRWSLGAGALFAGAGREELLRYSHLPAALRSPETVERIAARIPIWRRRRAWLRALRPSAGPTQEAIVAATLSLGIETEPTRLNFGRIGRADLVRLGSAVATELTRRGLYATGLDNQFDAFVAAGMSVGIADLARTISRRARRVDLFGRRTAQVTLSNTLREIAELGARLQYEDHESEGMLPLAEKVANARVLLETLGGSTSRAAPKARHVNTAFFVDGEDGQMEQLQQESTRLKCGELVHLGIRIGEKDASVVTLGSTALVEEILRSPGGATIEIGVTTIDFDLVGDPVQQLWLPEQDPTDLVTFAVVPRATGRVPGVARLRVSLFRDSNVVQSFLVAAALDGQAVDLAAAFGRALGVDAEEVASLGPVGYLARLEYSACSIDEGIKAEPRALTIIANESAGEKVVTFKGEELFTVSADPNLPGAVERVRAALDRASARDDDRRLYRYLYKFEKNAGDPDDLCKVLWDIALEGWGIFNTLVPGEKEQNAVRKLLACGGGIHAAHINAASVIPWALIYDRKVYERQSLREDPLDQKSPQYEVERALCRVAMPGPDGSMPDVECGELPGCLLHPSENVRRKAGKEKLVCADTVICPRRFWGFTVPIDVPAQQVSGVAGAPPPAVKNRIEAAQPIRIVAGFNPNLGLAEEHGEAVGTIAKGAHAAVTLADKGRRDDVVDLLEKLEPDIVYFFCHGLASLTAGGRTLGPSLDLGKGHSGVAADVLEARDLAGKEWAHSPLVFMNGCSTAGFSPYAPSTFIKEFIQGRKAAAVIGTEVTVWEVLGSEFAATFLKHFLQDKGAGEALLLARRALLAKYNPLGLVYTLYGSASLSIARAQAAAGRA